MKSILFMLPAVAHRPTGGFKVVYEYANRLVSIGYSVTCAYTITPLTPYVNNAGFFTVLAKHIAKVLLNCYTCRRWFNLDSRVKEVAVWNFNQKHMPYADVYVATAVRTSYFLDRYLIDTSRQKKLYFIQDFENWGCPDQFVKDSYKLKLQKFVISDWLLKLVKEQSENATLVYNGFDFEYFKLTNPIEKRNPYTIAMLYHEENRKRCSDAFAALDIVKKKIPDLRVNIFGQYPEPELPEWYTYYRRPDKETHNALLNEACIFVTASEAEGFALPPAEAMICGCAVCGTDIPGLPYLKNGETGLTAPVYDVQAMAKNIIRLINDNVLRIKLAKQGNSYIKTFTWDKSVNLMIREIEK